MVIEAFHIPVRGSHRAKDAREHFFDTGLADRTGDSDAVAIGRAVARSEAEGF